MQTVNIAATLPSGNTYGIDTPVERLTNMLPLEFLNPYVPVSTSISPGDVPSYRAAMAAATYVAQQETFRQMIRECWQPKLSDESQKVRVRKALDAAAPPVDLTEFAEDISAHWKQLLVLADAANEECGNRGLWFAALHQTATEGGGDSAAVYGVQYLKLRRQGHSAEKIAQCIATAICRLSAYN